jgi:hypothetical protein
MAQRDYEEQPEAPDLGASVQLESELHLGAPPGDRDALDAGYVPPDRPYALDEDGVTARGMREGDTLDQRLRRERRDEPADPDRAGRLMVAGGGAALEIPDDMDAVDVGIDGGAASAEEAAVHVSQDPAAIRETEPSVVGWSALDDPDLDADVGDDPLAEWAMADAARDGGADGATPDLPQDPADAGPATPELGDAAARIDASRGSDGAVAPASGRQDVGPEVWR